MPEKYLTENSTPADKAAWKEYLACYAECLKKTPYSHNELSDHAPSPTAAAAPAQFNNVYVNANRKGNPKFMLEGGKKRNNRKSRNSRKSRKNRR
jgi:hypothetical protein